MFDISFISYYLIAYLIGSIPTSVWVGMLFYKIDVRKLGSGNAGATNTFRVLGAKAAIPVLILDILKGAFATSLTAFNNNLNPETSTFVLVQILLGFCAILGHLWPVFAQFKGGKGVATLFGMVLILHPVAAILSFFLFSIFFFLTHYVSLSSIIGSFSFGVLVVFYFKEDRAAMIIFCLIIILLILYTHKRNIGRLFKGTEPKVHLLKKNKFN